VSKLEGMEMKYTVIKNEDLLSLPKGDLWKLKLENITDMIDVHKERETSNTYIVINTDEPYVEEVISIMKKHGHWGKTPKGE
jgi:hypothetical protein